MSKLLQPGENISMSSSGIVIVTHNVDQMLDVNLTAFLVTETGKVQGDNGIVYFNQPNGPSGVVEFTPPQNSGDSKIHKLNFDLSKAPEGITKIAITLTEDKGIGFVAVNNLKAEVHVEGEIIQLVPGSFATEKGIIVLELYLRNGQPKVKSVWQGFSSGLDGLCKHYGVDVEDSPVVTQAVTPPAVNLQKVSGKINLSKGQKPILIDKTPEITASISWQTGTDYDVYALVYTKDGRQVDVATFGAVGVKPLMSFENGAVQHMGDVGRSGDSVKTETIRIRLNDNILAVVPVAYSAQSNGTGSFHHYKVSMLIENHQGTSVTIPAKNANKDKTIYTCVPGIILNTPEGIVIDPVEYYSKPGSEHRPRLDKDGHGIKIIMDAGPVNNYK